MTSRRPRVGETRWRVEWCSKLAFYPDSTDVDHDRCTMKTKLFERETDAKRFAETEAFAEAKETFGVVEVDQLEFVPYDPADAAMFPFAGFWENCSDVQVFSGEWEGN